MSALPVEENKKIKETKTDDDNHSKIEKTDDDDHSVIIRCKCIGDGSKTLDDLIDRLYGVIKYVQHLQSAGWELINVMDDDYGFIRQK